MQKPGESEGNMSTELREGGDAFFKFFSTSQSFSMTSRIVDYSFNVFFPVEVGELQKGLSV